MIKPCLVKGTRDYDPLELSKRHYILNVIKQVYQKYCFEPLETPALETLTTLTEKYGQEGTQLIFKILNSGDFLANITDDPLETGYQNLLPKIASKGLRYDLTIPLMRYIVTHQHQLTFPLRRYQIQPVWRADKPQKGRYKEFCQCDADIVGTSSLICEGEILAMINEVLTKLGLKAFTININHRGILKGMAATNESKQEDAFSMTVDKLAKIGEEKVFEILTHQGFTPTALQKIKTIFKLEGSNQTKLKALHNCFENDTRGVEGVRDLQQILNHIADLGGDTKNIIIDPTLARGLTYYTGTVIEVEVANSTIGSIGGRGEIR